MKLYLIFILTVCTVLFPQFRNAPYSEDPRIKLLSDNNGGSFIDMSKLSMSHTFMSGYISSSSGSAQFNEYVAGIKYRISDPLTLKMNIGMSYMPYNSFALQERENSDMYLKSATLDYRPNDSFRMRIDFRNIRQQDLYLNTFNDPFNNDDHEEGP